MNKYFPKQICPKCNKELWDLDDSKEEIKCQKYNPRTKKKTGCKHKFKKKLHSLIGGEIYKENGHYVLEFEEHREKFIFPSWEKLKQQMESCPIKEKE